jgi:Xaa-Pro aminopeptidase
MTFDERLAAIRAGMIEQGLDLIVAVHDGAHFIETPNPVFVLSGFKSLGPAAVVLPRDGETSLIVMPAWDAERATDCCPKLRVVAAEDVVDALEGICSRHLSRSAKIGLAGLAATRWDIAGRLAQMLPQVSAADDIVFDAAAAKTVEEIAHAREATRIAELGYARLVEIARPGMSEDELAAELRWYTKTLGAELSRTARADLPHRHAWSGGRRAQAQIRLARARHGCRHSGRPTRGSDGFRLRRHQYGARDGGLWRILPPAAHPPARSWAGLRLDPAG